MNSFMKAKKEEMKSLNVKTIPKSLEKEKKEEKKTSSTFTFKDFQKSINKKESDTKTSIPTQTNLKSSLIVEKRNEDKLEKEKIEEEEEEKETEYNCEDESENECESECESECENESENEFEDEEEKEDKKLYSDLFDSEPSKSSNGEYKVICFSLLPFIFTEEYKKINGLALDTKISHYSALDKINSYIISENQFKLIEDQIKKKISRLLNTDTKNIKLELDKSNNCRFEYVCYVKVYKKLLDATNEDYYTELEFLLVNKTEKEFKKLYEEKYKKEYKANPDYDLSDIEFKYLNDYLKIYLENIYIHDNYCEDVLHIINRNCNFINPFQFIENTIAFKKIKTKSKGVINTTIMKMGFIFNNYVEEI